MPRRLELVWARAGALGRTAMAKASTGGRWAAYFVVVASVAIFAIREAARMGTPGFPYDDAYIVIHNARVILAGHDANYEGVSALFGATSAVHLAAVALVALFTTPAWASFVVASIGAAAYGLGLLRLAFAHGWSAAGAVLLAALGLVAAETPHQLYNGLETGLALAAVTWALAGYSEVKLRRAPRWLLILTGALPFFRPELAALSFLLVCGLGFDHARALAPSPWSSARVRTCARDVGRDVAWTALGAFPWMLWYAVATGAPWPQTAIAKRAFFAEECMAPMFRATWLWEGTFELLTMVGVFSLAGLFLVRTRTGRLALVFAGVLGVTYWARMPSAFWQCEHRYLYILVPFIFYAASAAWSSASRWPRVVVFALLVAGLVQSLPEVAEKYQGHRDYCRIRGEEYRAVGEWCRANLPPRARLLVHDAGFISESGDFALTDLVGLKTPSSIPVNAAHILATCGDDRAEATALIATKAHAAYLLVLVDWNQQYFKFSEDLAAKGWSVERKYTSPSEIYELYEIAPPTAPGPASSRL